MERKSAFVEGLEKFQKEKRQDTIKRVDDAIKSLQKDSKEVNFKSVSDISGITRKTLYKVESLRQLIANLRGAPNNISGAVVDNNPALEKEILELKEEKKQLKVLLEKKPQVTPSYNKEISKIRALIANKLKN